MYLIHVTGANSLKSILKNGYLKSFSLIKKSGKTPRDGATKKSDNKGKKMAVYMGGKWHHFGDSSMQDYRQHKSEKRKEAFYSRHAKNLKGNDSRSKAFRVYAKKTW
mgnify:CR=1 FL=1